MTSQALVNSVIASALLCSAAVAEEHTLANFADQDRLRWLTVNDGVMGGRSRGGFERTDAATLMFSGVVSLENNGGFSSIRSSPQPLKLEGYDGLSLRLRGDGRTYKVSLRTAGIPRMIAYWADVETVAGEWIDVKIPFDAWVPTSFGRRLPGPALRVHRINSVGFMLYDKKAGPFSLEVDKISAYRGEADLAEQPQARALPRKASPAPSSSPEPRPSSSAERARQLISLAIERGVPLFNEGQQGACQAVYEVAATSLLSFEGDLFSDHVRAGLRKALVRPTGPDWAVQQAWSLRRALDAAYAALHEEAPRPTSQRGL